MSAEVQNYSIAFLSSLLVSGAICWLAHQRNQTDCDSLAGPQKIHEGAVPRVGGMAVMIGVFVSLVLFRNVSISIFVSTYLSM